MSKSNQIFRNHILINFSHRSRNLRTKLIKDSRFVEGTINVGLPKFAYTIWPLEEGIKFYSTGDLYIDAKKAKVSHRYLSTDLGLEAVVKKMNCADCRLEFTATSKYRAHRRICVMRRVGYFQIIKIHNHYMLDF